MNIVSDYSLVQDDQFNSSKLRKSHASISSQSINDMSLPEISYHSPEQNQTRTGVNNRADLHKYRRK